MDDLSNIKSSESFKQADHAIIRVTEGLVGFSLCCCFLPQMICIIGATAAWGVGFCDLSTAEACSEGFMVMSTVKRNSTIIGDTGTLRDELFNKPLKLLVIEVSPNQWGVDFGKASAGSVKVSARARGGATSTAKTGTSNTVSGKALEAKGLDSPDNHPPYDASAHTPKLVMTTIGVVTIKSYRYFLFASQVVSYLQHEFPTKLWQLFLSKDLHGCPCMRGALVSSINNAFIPIEYILLSWVPTVMMRPLTSLRPGSEYKNTAIFKSSETLEIVGAAMMLFAIPSFLLLMGSDTWHGAETPYQGHGCCRVFLFCVRTLFMMMIVATVWYAVQSIVLDPWLSLGVDLSVLFKFSFRFGLVGWCSFVRFYTGLTFYVDFILSVLCFFHNRMKEPEKPSTAV